MKKRTLSVFLIVCMIVGMSAATVPALAADTVTAVPDSSSAFIEGGEAYFMFPVYTIDGDKYFKLRDLAYMLSGTKKQFEVEWDGANNAIILTSGESYTVVGGEMTVKSGVYKTAAPTSSKICLDGGEVQIAAYYIEGNNYFKLRDIAKAFDFSAKWDGAGNAFIIDTGKEYTEETGADTDPDLQNQLIMYLSELFTEAYEPYYDGLHYEMSGYEEHISDGEYSATFVWKMYYLGNGLDAPGDLGQEQEANWILQATARITADGRLDTSAVAVLADNSVTGPPTYQKPIEEVFPSIEGGVTP